MTQGDCQQFWRTTLDLDLVRWYERFQRRLRKQTALPRWTARLYNNIIDERELAFANVIRNKLAAD